MSCPNIFIPPAPHLLRIIFLFLPPQILLVPPLKAVLFTRVKLPEVMEVPVQPCIIATKDVQLSIVANWKNSEMLRV